MSDVCEDEVREEVQMMLVKIRQEKERKVSSPTGVSRLRDSVCEGEREHGCDDIVRNNR